MADNADAAMMDVQDGKEMTEEELRRAAILAEYEAGEGGEDDEEEEEFEFEEGDEDDDSDGGDFRAHHFQAQSSVRVHPSSRVKASGCFLFCFIFKYIDVHAAM